jgi:hypothetical protein
MKRIIAAAVFGAFAVAGCASMQSDAGWVTLVDGARGLENFNVVGKSNWRAEDGAIVADRNPEKTPSYLVSKNAYKDFMIHAEFWASDDANSGIFMRCSQPANPGDEVCYEANIFDQRPDPTYGTGAIVKVAKVAPMPKAGGKWNTYDLTAKGDQLTVVLNGQQTVSVRDTKLASGPFALQHGSGVIKWRKVQIKPL